jgi:hypothetical protein
MRAPLPVAVKADGVVGAWVSGEAGIVMEAALLAFEALPAASYARTV